MNVDKCELISLQMNRCMMYDRKLKTQVTFQMFM